MKAGLRPKLFEMILIMIPIFITQLALFSVSFFDTTMAGKLSEFDLAGVAISTSIWIPIYVGFSSIFLALTTIVAQLRGAEKEASIGKHVSNALIFSFYLTIVLIGIGSF